MAAPSLATEAALAKGHPSQRFNDRERQLLLSVKTYVDSLSPETLITTEGDLIVGAADGVAERLALGAEGLPLVAGAATVSYAQLEEAGIADDAITTDKILALNVTRAKLEADAIDGTKLADDAVSLEHLDSGIEPSHVIKFGAQFTTVGGAAAEAITVTGAAATDLAFVRLVNDGTNNVTISSWAVTTNTLTVTFSGDPGNDAVIDYILIRAAA